MSTVLYEPKGAVVRITLNRPQAMNAFDLPTARELGRRLHGRACSAVGVGCTRAKTSSRCK